MEKVSAQRRRHVIRRLPWSIFVAVLFVPAACLAPFVTPPGTDMDSGSPFGFHPAGVLQKGSSQRDYSDALRIGVAWARDGVYAFWEIADPMGTGAYQFDGVVSPRKSIVVNYDEQWATIDPRLHILANIEDESSIERVHADPEGFADFVYRLVERYDGDDCYGCTITNGVDCYVAGDGQYPESWVRDAFRQRPIKYWQIGNLIGKTDQFAELQRIAYAAVKRADSEAVVLLGGDGGDYAAVLGALAGTCVDILDIHYFGNAFGDYRDGIDLAEARQLLEQCGYPANHPIWVTEMGTYTGLPRGVSDRQTERDQAEDLVRRYVYLLSQGVEKVFWAYGLWEGYGDPDNDFWDSTGLIYDGRDAGEAPAGTRKLSYYTYQRMTEALAGADWDQIAESSLEAHVHAYRIPRGRDTLWVVWWDHWHEPGCAAKLVHLDLGDARYVQVTHAVPAAERGADLEGVTAEEAFPALEVEQIGAQLTLTLHTSPVYILAE